MTSCSFVIQVAQSGNLGHPGQGEPVLRHLLWLCHEDTQSTAWATPVQTHNALSRRFLGSAQAPFVMQPLQDKDSVTKRRTPQLDLPAFTRKTDLWKTLDTRLRRDDTQDEVIAGLDQYQQTAFNLLPQRPRAGTTPTSGRRVN